MIQVYRKGAERRERNTKLCRREEMDRGQSGERQRRRGGRRAGEVGGGVGGG